jgi:hypothetical protein
VPGTIAGLGCKFIWHLSLRRFINIAHLHRYDELLLYSSDPVDGFYNGIGVDITQTKPQFSTVQNENTLVAPSFSS